MRMSDLESTVKAITASVPQSYEKGSIVLSSLSEFLRLQALREDITERVVWIVLQLKVIVALLL